MHYESEWETPNIVTTSGGTLCKTSHYGKMRQDAELMAACREDVPWLIEQVEANWRGLLESERELLDAQTRLGRMQAVVDAAREVLRQSKVRDVLTGDVTDPGYGDGPDFELIEKALQKLDASEGS